LKTSISETLTTDENDFVMLSCTLSINNPITTEPFALKGASGVNALQYESIDGDQN
jgi:hypothetical protein